MAIEKELLDQLLAGRDPNEVFSKNGLVDDLKKALSERILSAELDEHLDDEREAGGPANRRNGVSTMSILTGTSKMQLSIPRDRAGRTIKEATVTRFHYDDHEQLRQHLTGFVAAFDFARRLKSLEGLTPYEYICKCWTSQPQRFKIDPIHQMPGLNI